MEQHTEQPPDDSPPLAHPNLRRLLVGQFCTIAAVYGLALAGAVLIESQTQSSAQTAIALVSVTLPAFLTSLFAGAVVDRWGRVPVLVVSHLGRMLASLGFFAGALFLPPELTLLTVLSVNAVSAALTQFATPAEQSLLPDIVGKARLLSSNAIYQLTMLGAEGFGVGVLVPTLILLFDIPSVGLVGAALCLVAALSVAALPRALGRPETKATEGRSWKDIWQELQGGWKVIARDPLLRTVVAQATLAAAMLLVLVSLVPGLTARVIGVGVEFAPILLVPGGIGFFVVSLLLGRWERWLAKPTMISLGLVGVGLSQLALALVSTVDYAAIYQPAFVPGIALVVPTIVGMGCMLAMVVVPARTILQERPPAEMRGRVIAAQLALTNAAAVIPLLLGGAIADRIGIQPVMAGMGVLAAVAGLLGLWHRRMRPATPA